MIFTYIRACSFLLGIFIFAGCSGKTQVNPTDPKEISWIEKDFKNSQRDEKEKKDLIEQGRKLGYEKAKEEFSTIIPYLEAIRASAEINAAGGLCLPPLFMDKSDSRSIKLLVGEVHLCNNFSVDEVIKMAKNGIPGLPEKYSKSSESQVQKSSVTSASSFTPSGIEVVGQTDNFYTNKASDLSQPKKVQVESTKVNRDLLRKINSENSIVETRDEAKDISYLVITFKNSKDADSFCKQYTICL